MNAFVSAVIWLLALNLWVAVGCLVLARGIRRWIIDPPGSMVTALALMVLWPWLLLQGLRVWALARGGSSVSEEPDAFADDPWDRQPSRG